MNSQLRPDEDFVIRSVASHFLGTWRPGENPPDAYMEVGGKTVAIEISSLNQHVSYGSRYKPRRSEDAPAIWLANTLNCELKTSIPDGMRVILTLTSPILQAQKTKTKIKEKIFNLLSSAREFEVAEDIQANRICIRVGMDEGHLGKKVVAVITNANLSRDIFRNAWHILEDRIVVKAKKCSPLPYVGPKWLALLIDYGLADNATYQKTFDALSVDHPFEKILLVANNGLVTVLHEKITLRRSRSADGRGELVSFWRTPEAIDPLPFDPTMAPRRRSSLRNGDGMTTRSGRTAVSATAPRTRSCSNVVQL